MELRKFRINELEAFITSELFCGFDIKPISPLRIKSYIANPRAKEDDIVLYLLTEENKLVAFRAVLPDLIFPEIGNPIRFAWCSGVWIHPDYRGKKLWKKLLDEAMTDWEKRLMLTNYAPITESLYTKEYSFQILQHRLGYRFYYNPNFKERFSNPILIPLATLGNMCAKLIFKIKAIFVTPIKPIKTEEISCLDHECINLLHTYSSVSLFNRMEEEIHWIINYPWVMEEKTQDYENYPFSFHNINYKIKVVKYFLLDKFAGFFIYSIVNRKMKILYYFETPEFRMTTTLPVIQITQTNDISHLTVLSSPLADLIKKQSKYYLFSKHFTSNIYSTFTESSNGKCIFDGDGDNCFT